MDAFYDPNYESGKPVRWRIEQKDKKPFGVAAIYDRWKSPASGNDSKDDNEPSGRIITSFSLLTVNPDNHLIKGQFHPPGDEKRSI